MALQIPVPLQNVGMSAQDVRVALAIHGLIQEGVANRPDFRVTWPAGTLVPTIAQGYALVRSGAGYYTVSNVNTNITTGVTGGAVGNASLPRIDQVILKVNDRFDLAGSTDGCTVFIRQGTPTSGATLDNRAGAAADPAVGELRLADLLMPAGGTQYTDANCRDRRKFAGGAHTMIVGNNSGDITTTSTSDVNAANHTVPRIELTAGNLLQYTGTVHMATTAGTALARVINNNSLGTNAAVTPYVGIIGTNTFPAAINHEQVIAASGSTLTQLVWKNNVAGTATMQNNVNFVTRIIVRETPGAAGFNENF